MRRKAGFILVIVFLSFLFHGCDFYSPGGFLAGLGVVQPNLEGFLPLENGGDNHDNPLLTVFDDMIVAQVGKKLYIIDEDTFTIDEEYDFYFNVGNAQLKISESASREVFTYLSNDDDKYILDDDDNVVRKLRVNATGASDIGGEYYAYFSYDGSDMVGLYLYNDENERDEVQFFTVGSDFLHAVIPLPKNTRVMGMEFVGDTIYVVAAPTFSSDNVEEPLEIMLGAFPADEVSEWHDNEDWDWEKIHILDLCRYYGNFGEDNRSFPCFSTSITDEGILLFGLPTSLKEPNSAVLSLKGDIRARFHHQTHEYERDSESACISSRKQNYYILTNYGLYKYGIP